MATDGLFRVDSVGHATTGVSHHLIRDKDSNVKLLTEFLYPIENFG
jgi:hypothetical protein